jgi:hypothetical protein
MTDVNNDHPNAPALLAHRTGGISLYLPLFSRNRREPKARPQGHGQNLYFLSILSLRNRRKPWTHLLRDMDEKRKFLKMLASDGL